MPVEQGLPWHLVATGLAGQAIPFVVAASHAHAFPSPQFWFPPGVAPAFCVSVLLLPLSVGAPGCPFCAPTPVPTACPPYTDFTSPYDVDYPARSWLVTALLPPPWRAPPGARGAAPALVEFPGTS